MHFSLANTQLSPCPLQIDGDDATWGYIVISLNRTKIIFCKKGCGKLATNVSDFDPDMKAFLTEEFLVDAEDPHTDTVLTEVESNGGEGRKMCGAAAAGYAGSQY